MVSTSLQSRHHFEYILVGMVVLLLVIPAIRQVAPVATVVLQPLAIGAAFATAIWTLSVSSSWRLLGVVLGILLGALGTVGTLYDLTQLQVAVAIGFFGCCGWFIAATLRDVLVGPQVDVNRVMGAVCVYMMLGVFWGISYVLIGLFDSSAFTGITSTDYDALVPQLFYFSFVTMTTLGYGDISPVAPLARSLAYLQAVIGQMYVAILVAGLVSAHVAERMGRPSGDDG
jgi:hypothetical protein